MKKKKLKSLPTLRRRLDKVFSDFIRQRGAWDEYNNCVTCGMSKPWQELQCGHYYSRRHTATRYDERNCHPQCGRCNVLLRGNYPSYARYMQAKYGQGILDELEALHRDTVKWTRQTYEALIAKYAGGQVDSRGAD